MYHPWNKEDVVAECEHLRDWLLGRLDGDAQQLFRSICSRYFAADRRSPEIKISRILLPAGTSEQKWLKSIDPPLVVIGGAIEPLAETAKGLDAADALKDDPAAVCAAALDPTLQMVRVP
jgi:hypothetical protein